MEYFSTKFNNILNKSLSDDIKFDNQLLLGLIQSILNSLPIILNLFMHDIIIHGRAMRISNGMVSHIDQHVICLIDGQ